jgi:hypothetical protein
VKPLFFSRGMGILLVHLGTVVSSWPFQGQLTRRGYEFVYSRSQEKGRFHLPIPEIGNSLEFPEKFWNF